MKKSDINEIKEPHDISRITEINEKTPLSLFFNPHTAREIYSKVNFVNALPDSFLSKQPSKAEAPIVAKGRYESIPGPEKK
ncbi:MAG: hypothetical protein K2Q33_03250 [Gammaproteobacteria bacterium]|nr:hypothetical protein [Gammaproteobacteria bacterium]